MRLNEERTGGGDGRPLLIAHGLFGSARNWRSVAKRLGEGREVVTVDLRNHGDSPWDDDASYDALAGDLAGTVEAMGGRADVLGHSMGGKAAMRLALTRPDLVERLVVADIAPVAYGHSQQHLIDAMRAVTPAAGMTRGAADRALAARVDEPGVRAFLLQSLDRAEGRWVLNLDALEAGMAGILGWPETDARFEGPVLVVAGGASDYVRPEHRETIRALFPAARVATLPGAGHWLHAEAPEAFVETVRLFLDA